MKINRIIIIIIAISTIMNFSTSYGATKKEPRSNAKADEIVEYLKTNKITATKLTSNVEIQKLSNWYKTLSKKTGTDVKMYEKMIVNALEDKSKNDINEFVNSKDENALKSFEPKDVLSNWVDKVTNKNKRNIINDIIATETNAVIDPTSNPSNYNPGEASTPANVKKKVGIILGAINNIGVVVAVIILMIIGIKYMLGSAEEKANYKETILPYLIGVAILFMGSTIPNIIYKTMK